MLSVDLSHATSSLCFPHEAVWQPRLDKATQWLQNGGGKGDDFIGWVHLPRDYDATELARVEAAAKQIQNDSQALVVIGVGGSYLGARGVIDALCSPNYNLKKKSTPNVYFIGNDFSATAMADLTALLTDVDFSVNVISKSGTTTEPAVAFRFVRALMERKYGKDGAAKRTYVTTDRARGVLKAYADGVGCETFTVPDDIGGRYSVLSSVGLLPIAVAGIDVRALLGGAREMMDVCAAADYGNPAWQYAAIRNELYHGGRKIEVLSCFDPSFRFMGEWWKQLFGESEGKEKKGIFPASTIFTADLHSMGQYIQQGERDLFETIVRFAPDDTAPTVPFDADNGDALNYLAGKSLSEINEQATDGTLLAHEEGGVPVIVLNAGRCNAHTLGELIYFFEYSCGLSAYLLGVNPFDQPGVEAYKANMFALLGKPGYEEQAKALREKLSK